MDPFEEFEFKPITDGLGFHPKPNTAKKTERNEPSGLNPRRNKLDFVEKISEPLPRKKPGFNNSNASLDQSVTSQAVDDILQTLHRQKSAAAETKKDNVWTLCTPHWASMILDTLLVTASFLMCLIAVLFITQVDLVRNLTHPDQQNFVIISLAGLYVTVAFIYMIFYRVFLGHTPGEWAYEIRLGKPEAQDSASYAGRVLVRQLFVTLTGFVVFPLISMLFSKDYLAEITNLNLFEKTGSQV